ncbi:hypothetical protein D9M68_772790 [compost metagenome]
MEERLAGIQAFRDLHNNPSPFVCVQGGIHGARERRDADRGSLVGRIEKTRLAGNQRFRGHGQVGMADFRQPIFGRDPVEHAAIGRQLEKFQHQVRLLHG